MAWSFDRRRVVGCVSLKEHLQETIWEGKKMCSEGHILWAIWKGLHGHEFVDASAGDSAADHQNPEKERGHGQVPEPTGIKVGNKHNCLNPGKEAGLPLCHNHSTSPAD